MLPPSPAVVAPKALRPGAMWASSAPPSPATTRPGTPAAAKPAIDLNREPSAGAPRPEPTAGTADSPFAPRVSAAATAAAVEAAATAVVVEAAKVAAAAAQEASEASSSAQPAQQAQQVGEVALLQRHTAYISAHSATERDQSTDATAAIPGVTFPAYLVHRVLQHV